MKIAVICPDYPPSAREGGVSHFVQILARHLTQLGEKVTVLTDGSYRGDGKDEAVDVITLAGPWDSRTTGDIVRLAKDESIEIVNLQYTPPMYSTAFKLSWRRVAARVPSVISFHTLWGGSKVNYLAALCLLATRSSIVATNSELVYLLDKRLPFFKGKTCTIPIGSNIPPSPRPTDTDALRKKYALTVNVPIVSYFGMCYPGKGMDTLLLTAKTLASQDDLDFRLVLIGGGGSDVDHYLSEMRRLSDSHGVWDRVVWTGKIPAGEVSTLLSMTDVVLLPYEKGVSDRRGSLMAALAHGRAIVTSAPRIRFAFFRNQENMVWPMQYTPEAFAGEVLRVLRDDALRKRLEAGALRLSNYYQWTDIAERTRDWFRKTVEKH
jgi:glycosyltransferase involved in cell wall biosynthesis